MSWKQGELVRIQKLQDRQDISDTEKISEMPVDKTVVGFLATDVCLGMSVSLIRIIRDGRAVYGEFVTSPLQQITGNHLITEHSIYRIVPVGLEVIEL
jgi:hypothetical protein